MCVTNIFVCVCTRIAMYIIVDETKHTIPVKKTTQQYENEDYVDGVDVGI